MSVLLEYYSQAALGQKRHSRVLLLKTSRRESCSSALSCASTHRVFKLLERFRLRGRLIETDTELTLQVCSEIGPRNEDREMDIHLSTWLGDRPNRLLTTWLLARVKDSVIGFEQTFFYWNIRRLISEGSMKIKRCSLVMGLKLPQQQQKHFGKFSVWRSCPVIPNCTPCTVAWVIICVGRRLLVGVSPTSMIVWLCTSFICNW